MRQRPQAATLASQMGLRKCTVRFLEKGKKKRVRAESLVPCSDQEPTICRHLHCPAAT